MAVNSVENEHYRIVLIPEIEHCQATTIKSFVLPDPRTGRSQGFLLANGSLMEINRFKQAYSSWLMGDRLLTDGGMFLATVYDPLFVLLPVLDRARDKDENCPLGKFKQLEELLYDESMPGISELLPCARGGGNADGVASAAIDGSGTVNGPSAIGSRSSFCEPDEAAMATEYRLSEHGVERDGEEQADQGEGTEAATEPPLANTRQALRYLDQQLACICDLRRVDGMTFYRLNEDRVLAWLCCKFRRIQAALAPQLVGMDAPHAAAYVLGFLSEYVNDKWISRVATRLGINEKELAANNAAVKPMEGNAQGTARPGAPLAGPPEKKQKTDPRVAAKQASLAKQAVGTKKMTSFFAKK
ncbi:hypothetical protein Vretimale_5625 [Volvox reticuliferus]|uniref:Ribonuclease H2 subunit B n=1 Tax=Volvox reticuliferus TaxID=1737510 RepID=A0A8J4C9P9_9CHLO|nr:hypothetical protein Vretifemale_5655 [Volvox reticuliferus]GIM00685.1 hypothetical protein Vretimale_5625 [Volvox reticuliferus]